MNTNIVPLVNSIKIPLLDRDGTSIEDDHTLVNTPFAEFFPNEPIAIIDWMHKQSMRPREDEVAAPIEYNGHTFHGHYAWGSGVKKGQTVGLTRDIGRETGMFSYVEDGQRFVRWLLSQGWYGGIRGTIRIGVLPPGTNTPHGPVEDGFGYISSRLAQIGYNNRPKIKMGRARGSYTMWQRIRPWTPELEAELLPAINERLLNIADATYLLIEQGSTFQEKLEYRELEELMLQHPWIGNALTRVAAETMSRVATTAKVDSIMRVAVPTIANKVCGEIDSKQIICRYPVDSNGSIQAVDPGEEDPQIYAMEKARITNMEVIQITIASLDFMSKGCVGVVNGELFNGYDVIICSEDVKMAKLGVKEVRKRSEITLDDAVITFPQWFTKGSAIGINARWAKKRMGLDHDGDMVEITDCKERPVLYQTVKNLLPGETPKLNKTKRSLDEYDGRADMIVKSMSNLVGFASNVASKTFTVEDRAGLAQALGFRSEQAMDSRLNFWIKAGTDGFKTDIDLQTVERELAQFQTHLDKLLPHTIPVCKWPDQEAFVHFIPDVIEAEVKDNDLIKYRVIGYERPIFLSKTRKDHAIWPNMTGTIASICRLTLPHLANILQEPIKVRPLVYFRNWAEQVPDEVLEGAKEIQEWYNANSRRTNWSDPESINTFKTRLAQEVDAWIQRAGINRQVAAAGLWRVAHSARGENAGAGSVFLAFPEETRRIVAEKPGRPKAFKTILTGLAYQLPGVSTLEAEVEVVEVVEVKSGKALVRKAIVGNVAGQVPPRNSMYPANMLAMIAQGSDQPENGKYLATIEPASANSWKAQLNPIH